MSDVVVGLLVYFAAVLFATWYTRRLIKGGGWWAQPVASQPVASVVPVARAHLPVGGVVVILLSAVTGIELLAAVGFGFAVGAIIEPFHNAGKRAYRDLRR